MRRDVERAAFLLMLLGISMGLFLTGFSVGYILGDGHRVVLSAPATIEQ